MRDLIRHPLGRGEWRIVSRNAPAKVACNWHLLIETAARRRERTGFERVAVSQCRLDLRRVATAAERHSEQAGRGLGLGEFWVVSLRGRWSRLCRNAKSCVRLRPQLPAQAATSAVLSVRFCQTSDAGQLFLKRSPLQRLQRQRQQRLGAQLQRGVCGAKGCVPIRLRGGGGILHAPMRA